MTTKKTPLRAAPLPPADQPVPLNLPIASAWKNLVAGTATPDQMKLAVDWLMKAVCLHGQQAYRDNDRDTNFICGRQFVAQQVAGALNLDIATLRRIENDG